MSDFPPAAALPNLPLLGGTPATEDVFGIVDRWLAALQRRLEQNAEISDLFVEEA